MKYHQWGHIFVFTVMLCGFVPCGQFAQIAGNTEVTTGRGTACALTLDGQNNLDLVELEDTRTGHKRTLSEGSEQEITPSSGQASPKLIARKLPVHVSPNVEIMPGKGASRGKPKKIGISGG